MVVPQGVPSLCQQLSDAVACIYFFPDFLMPCWPVFRGPLPLLAFSAISLRALASAAILALCAASTSSSSFFSFLGAWSVPCQYAAFMQGAGSPRLMDIESHL